jgi:hypothetical protein
MGAGDGSALVLVSSSRVSIATKRTLAPFPFDRTPGRGLGDVLLLSNFHLTKVPFKHLLLQDLGFLPLDFSLVVIIDHQGKLLFLLDPLEVLSDVIHFDILVKLVLV